MSTAISVRTVFWVSYSLLVVLLVSPALTISCLIRRLIKGNHLSLDVDLPRSLRRGLQSFTPLSAIQILAGNSDPLEDALSCPRFRPFRSQLCGHVQSAEAAGYWLTRGPPGKPQDPAQSDAVILRVHGGAYIVGHATSGLFQMLRVTEVLASKGLDASMFSLAYTLAPKGTFPTQQNQAIAAYQYLIEECKIDPANIIILGESAGGHLALSMLTAMAEKGVPRPGGLVLLSPWVDLSNSTGESYRRNQYYDILNKGTLDTCARAVVGPNGFELHAPSINLAVPHSDRASWKDILPCHTWINVGTLDLFHDSILAFKDAAISDGAAVELDVKEGGTHSWHSRTDGLAQKAYYDSRPEDTMSKEMLPGSENIAMGLLAITNKWRK